MKVQDIMSREVITVEPGASVSYAAGIMSIKEIGCLVVLEKGEIAGIFTERDILSRVVAEGKDAKKTLIGEIMSKPVITADKNMDVEKAVRVMEGNKIRRLPVLEGKKLTGIVTSTDIVLGAKSRLPRSADAKNGSTDGSRFGWFSKGKKNG
jgi:CBS domain-containing protein